MPPLYPAPSVRLDPWETQRGVDATQLQEPYSMSNTSPLSVLKDPSLLKTDALINGNWIKGASRFDVLDPATGHKLADVANLGPADAEAAIAAANAA